MFLLEVLFPFLSNVTAILLQYWLGAQSLGQSVGSKPPLESPRETGKELNEHVAAARSLPGGQIRWPNTACSFAVSMIPKQKQNIVSTEKGEMLFVFFWEMFSCVPALRTHSLLTLPTLSATWMDSFPYSLAKNLETSSRQKLVEKNKFFRFFYPKKETSWVMDSFLQRCKKILCRISSFF